MKALHTALAAIIVFTAPIHAQEGNVRARLQARLEQLLAGSNTPGATAAVVLPDGHVIAVAAGLADTATKQKMTPQSRLPSGSTGKTFVAAIVLQLVGEGRIGLDDPISKYFGNEPWFARLPNRNDITVRMLLNHTSGIPDHVTNEKFIRAVLDQPKRAWKPAELVSYVLDQSAQSAAGSAFHYTDTNYILLGMLIEGVTGSTYYAELERRILQPRKLSDIIPNDRQRLAGVVQGYSGGLERAWLAYDRKASNNAPRPGSAAAADAMLVNGEFVVNPQFEWTGGGLSTTATDLARWTRDLLQGRAYRPALIREVLQCTPRPDTQSCYGLGVSVTRTPEGVRYGHGGFFPGYRATMAYFPEQRVAVALQTNSTSSDAKNFAEAFVADAVQMVSEGGHGH